MSAEFRVQSAECRVQSYRVLFRTLHSALCTLHFLSACSAPPPPSPQCDAGNGGVTLPAGFCAGVFADQVGVARHLVVSPAGILYVALEDGRESSAGTTQLRGAVARGGILALRDTTGDGRADQRVRFPTAGGTGIALRGDTLWFSTVATVQRLTLTPDGLALAAGPDTVVRDLPVGGHASRSLALDDSGHVFVNVGSDGNVCEEYTVRGKAADPCPELVTRAGIWRYRADRPGQLHPRDGERWATGVRNGVALAWNGELGALFAATHGRDGLVQQWPRLYSRRDGAEKPAEELLRLERGQDYGWPYCYFDRERDTKVQAPEYGGDGKTPGRCAAMARPVVAFPGHWGPDGLHFYRGAMFPSRFRGGAFLAFHGSWNRAPEPQAGYRVVFVPVRAGRFEGSYETFADGFAGRWLDPSGARFRPVGVGEGPDGALYLTDDQRGRVWRVVAIGHRP